MATITTQILDELYKTNNEISGIKGEISGIKGEISGVKGEVSKINICLIEHLAYDKGNRQKIDDMYKIIVTGNGDLPLPETVRKHKDWIENHDKEQNNIEKYNQEEMLQVKKYNQEESLQAKKDTRDDRNEAITFKRQLWLLALGQVLTIIGLAVSVFLKLR